MRRGLWVIAAAGLFTACTSLSGLTPSPDDAGASADAAPNADVASTDGGSPADGPSEGVVVGDGGGPVNLLKNPGFEQSLGSGCTDWTVAFGGTAVLSDVAHTGAHSCLLCPNDSVVQYSGVSQYDITTNATSYYAEMWVRAPDNGASAPPNASVVLYETLPDGGPSNHQASFVQPSATWGLSSITATVGAGDKIQFELHGYFPAGGCVLIDDAALYAR